MKKRPLVFILISVTAAAVLTGGCATSKKSISEGDFFETWSGTWVNTDLPGNNITPQKIVTHPDGTIDYYSTAENRNSAVTVVFILSEKWTDPEGTTWFKASRRCDVCDYTVFEFGKLNSSGETYELIYHIGSEKIDAWEPDNPLYSYAIYYRQ